MPLSREQFQQLRDRNLSVEQIVKFERGEKPAGYVSPAPPPPPEQKTVSGFVGNIFKSTGRLAKDTAVGVGSAVFHPKRTLESIADPLTGLTATAIGKGKDPRFADYVAKADVVGQFYKDRYGSGQKIKDTLYGDPAGAASDLSTFFTGTGSLLSKTGQVSKIQALTKAGNLATKTGEIVNPLTAVSKVAGPVTSRVSSRLQTSAEKQYSQALGATTKEMKLKSEKVVPGLLERKTTAFTQQGLQAKAEAMAEKFGGRIEDAWDAVPEGTYRTNIKPVFDDLQKRKIGYTVNGVIVDDAAYNAVESMQKKLLAVSDVDVSPQSMREFRQILDKATSRTKKSFALGDADSAIAETRKATANAIRTELGNDLPDIAKLNKEFSFWSNVDEIMSETIMRRKPQAGLMEPLAQTLGLATGSTLLEKVLGAFAYKNFVKLTRSTGWRTVSAVNKQRLANLLAAGNGKEAGDLVNTMLNQAATLQRSKAESE